MLHIVAVVVSGRHRPMELLRQLKESDGGNEDKEICAVGHFPTGKRPQKKRRQEASQRKGFGVGLFLSRLTTFGHAAVRKCRAVRRVIAQRGRRIFGDAYFLCIGKSN